MSVRGADFGGLLNQPGDMVTQTPPAIPERAFLWYLLNHPGSWAEHVGEPRKAPKATLASHVVARVPTRACYFPLNSGARFSTKAKIPSRTSSVPKQMDCA